MEAIWPQYKYLDPFPLPFMAIRPCFYRILICYKCAAVGRFYTVKLALHRVNEKGWRLLDGINEAIPCEENIARSPPPLQVSES